MVFFEGGKGIEPPNIRAIITARKAVFNTRRRFRAEGGDEERKKRMGEKPDKIESFGKMSCLWPIKCV